MIGVLPGRRLSFLDHLFPLCQMMEIPLLLTDPWLYELAELYYPSHPLILDTSEDISLDRSLKGSSVLFTLAFGKQPSGHVRFFEYFYSGEAKTVYSLHGNSDKNRNCFSFEGMADEDVVLLYGEYFVDFAKEKGVWDRIKKCILCGNYRLEYYRKNKAFFDAKIPPYLFRHPQKRTILYAPTWTSSNLRSEWRDHYSSFFETYPYVLDAVPEGYQVIVKLHPYLELHFPEEVEEVKARYDNNDQITFLSDFPLIYPLLSKVDVYLGDYSSVGYDFLAFDRPLFFLNDRKRSHQSDKGVYLFQCGVSLGPEDFPNLYSIIEQTDPEQHAEIRKKTYRYAFGEKKPLPLLKQEILEALQ